MVLHAALRHLLRRAYRVESTAQSVQMVLPVVLAQQLKLGGLPVADLKEEPRRHALIACIARIRPPRVVLHAEVRHLLRRAYRAQTTAPSAQMVLPVVLAQPVKLGGLPVAELKEELRRHALIACIARIRPPRVVLHAELRHLLRRAYRAGCTAPSAQVVPPAVPAQQLKLGELPVAET